MNSLYPSIMGVLFRFVVLAGITAAIVYLVYLSSPIALVAVLALFLVGYTFISARVIDEGYEAIVQRFGRYHRKLTPGISFIVPGIDRIVWVGTTREMIMEVQPLEAITKDNFSIQVSVIAYWRMLEMQQTYYTIEDSEEACKNVIVPHLRALINRTPLENVLSSRDEIERSMMDSLDEATATWGIKITRVAVENIVLPQRTREYLENRASRTTDTISIPFPDGVDWQAVQYSFQKVIVENEGIEIDVRGIETREDGTVVIKVKIPQEFDRDKVISELIRTYEMATRALESRYNDNLKQLESVREQNSNLINVIGQLGASQSHQINLTLNPTTVDVKAIAEGKAMTNSSDSSRNIQIGNVGGDFTASGSALNLGDISGTVTNALNQIPPTAAGNDLKAYLTELLEAIQTDPNLPAEEKPDAEEAVGAIATAAQSDEPEARQSVLARASRTLNRMAQTLPDATKFVQAVNKLLPLIAGIL